MNFYCLFGGKGHLTATIVVESGDRTVAAVWGSGRAVPTNPKVDGSTPGLC